MLKNDTLIRALLRQPTSYTPVWLMRQAGRYLPEYNATRARAGSFLALAKNPDLATEVTLQPLARFPLDAAIVFSDILTIPDAMGLGLGFAEGEGPRFEHPLREEREIRALTVPDPGRQLRYVIDTVAQVRKALAGSVPVIGFSGSPFTLACYMVEGCGSRDFPTVKAMLRDRPELLHHILEVNCRAVIAYLNAQIEAGAQAVMVFDTWGGTLAEAEYRECSLGYMQRIVEGIRRERDGRRVPSILFTKGGGAWLEAIAASGCDAVSLDWTVDIGAARARVGHRVALQGNLDPEVLLAGPQAVRDGVAAVLASFGRGSGHVFNLGHGVTQHTPPENVAALVEAVHKESRAYH
ncbi:MAG: uroporphyrinogen decarboxylase [Betaproteobacteria bacterium RIFCSPLOWO2_02_FULL_67_26]|nr:MAG: uroporphyrinogen decarboxylase [Betaproteobacteria bacterium RIFCSPLOWO2_02_FULL_67_26]